MKFFLSINKYYYVTIVLFIVIGGVLLLTMHKADITIWVNSHHNSFYDWAFRITDHGGVFWFSVLIVAAIGVLKDWKTALKAAVCFISTALIVHFFKYVIFPGELRPTLYFEGKYTLRILDGIVQLKTESFPSGHTAAAFSIATFLALFSNKKQWHWLLAAGAASVGYARLYLSQHFITDVYTGMLIGVITTTLVYYFYSQKFERKK
ncbi:MAG: phosphatase PAP2 family protein [Dysgonamonadaceae bacterium]|jgi:membrane-associated phospholipid phosphatase|nr:phosphatase PAP2 family protein [Dysgonamonadaceae bacterium]